MLREKIDGITLCRRLTDRTDDLVLGLARDLPDYARPHWCMIAVGGYGRMELCPFSDIDLLIIVDRKASHSEVEKTLKGLLYPLWDKGFTVGYSVRTLRQALSDAHHDFFFLTSLLDARYLCGRKDLFQELVHSIGKNRQLTVKAKFFRLLDAHIEKRHERYGDASYILEPDIKEGKGSLRDYHCLMWAIRAASLHDKTDQSVLNLPETDHRELLEAAEMLLRIRYALHEIAGRKTDRLSFEYQDALAERLGYRGNGNERASELLMRSFHHSALAVKSIAGSARVRLAIELGLYRPEMPRPIDRDFQIASGFLSFIRPEELSERPALLLDIFVKLAENGGALSHDARDVVRRSLRLLESVSQSQATGTGFIHILRGTHSLAALTSMLETGALERFMPEFSSIKGRTQVDAYHTWTTDLHSIRTVYEMYRLEKEETEAFSMVRELDVLFLAAFLHDIGKGYGRPHAEHGAPVARDIAKRLGFSDHQAELCAFLVRHHLLLTDTAYRRDLSEEKVALECARIAHDEERLAMLYLLSVADSRATGPRAWDDWKARLLRELFFKAANSLRRGILRDPQTMIVLEERWSRLIAEIPSEQGQGMGGRLWVLPQAYVIHTDIEQIKRHLRFSTEIADMRDIRLDIIDKGDYARLTIIAKDRPGLFAELAGILIINHLDILSAQVFTWLNGIAVDTFHVLPPWEDYCEWERIREHFIASCSGRMDIAAKVASMRPLRTKPCLKKRIKPQIIVDNTFSDFFTLIDVHSPRRFGLLYRMARAISSLRLNIHRAFLSHTGDPCTDVFYVVDELGEKVMEEVQMKAIEQAIIAAVE